jgi:hypothetical protein
MHRDASQRQTASRLRPFWRRRFKTRRPPFERIRTRKPWVRFRFRLLGWNVLFMLILSIVRVLTLGVRRDETIRVT